MKCCKIFLFLTLLVYSQGFSKVLKVPNEHNSIQEAIDVASAGDTILVARGVYKENLVITKQLNLFSNFVYSNDNRDIEETILDGDQTSSVIFINNVSEVVNVIGFSITNGIGTSIRSSEEKRGGGINIHKSSAYLKYLDIYKNSAFWSGGIFVDTSTVTMNQLQIFDNEGGGVLCDNANVQINSTSINKNSGAGIRTYSTTLNIETSSIIGNYSGGGIALVSNSICHLSSTRIVENSCAGGGGAISLRSSSLIFDDENCSIYFNSAYSAQDLYSYQSPTVHAVLDTFTVKNPGGYYLGNSNGFDLTIKNAKVLPVSTNLYVSVNGDDNNNGLTEATPLKRISTALRSLEASENNPCSIYVDEGIYDWENNGEIFPFSFKSNVHLIGKKKETTLINANRDIIPIVAESKYGVSFENFTIVNSSTENGQYAAILMRGTSINLENITIKGSTVRSERLISFYGGYEVICKGIELIDCNINEGACGIYFSGSHLKLIDSKLENLNVEKGSGVEIYRANSVYIENCLFNEIASTEWGGALYIDNCSNVIFDRSRITSNHARFGGGVCCEESNITFTDCIIYNNVSSRDGAGLALFNSTVNFEGTTIANNKTYKTYGLKGGGIYSEDSFVHFSNNNLCSIYNNYASLGREIYSEKNVVGKLDTFAVKIPNEYYVCPKENFSLEVQTGLIEQHASDLYVSPTGDDNNSGLSFANPLRTINKAMALIATNEETPRTIYLDEGIYSANSNGEAFPIFLVDNVKLTGLDKTRTILRGDSSVNILSCINLSECYINQITLENTINHSGGMHISFDDYFILDSNAGLAVLNSCIELTDLVILNSTASGISSFFSTVSASNIEIENCGYGLNLYRGTNNIFQNCNLFNCTAGAYFKGSFEGDLMNCTFSNNYWAGVVVESNARPCFRNCSLSNNLGYGCEIRGANIDFCNCIVSENQDTGIFGWRANINLAGTLIKDNSSTLRGGGIFLYDEANLIFDESNKCSIYNNFASEGKDIYNSSRKTVKVVVDTFSVKNPNSFYCQPIQSFEFDIQNGKIIQTEQDLYVNIDGNDNNDGITESSSLRSVSSALSRVNPTNENTIRINIGEGTFSPENTLEQFPLVVPAYVELVGSGISKTILDADSTGRVMNISDAKEVSINHLSLVNGSEYHGGGLKIDSSEVKLNQVGIKNNEGGGAEIVNSIIDANRIIVTGNNIKHSPHQAGSTLGGLVITSSEFKINNSTIVYNVGYSMGGIFSNGSSGSIINSIVWGNYGTGLVAYWYYREPEKDSLIVVNSDIEYGARDVLINDYYALHWINNYDIEPSFAGVEVGDFSLKKDSPLIDEGVDFFSWYNDTLICLADDEYDGKAPDVGALEYSENQNIKDIPEDYVLFQNYPNPFNSSTILEFALPEISDVQVRIYSILGEEIRSYYMNNASRGFHKIIWDGTTNNNKQVSSGVYIYTFEANNDKRNCHKSEKMLLLK